MKKQKPDLTRIPHRRKNILTGDWLLVSPHRTQRPWQGEVNPFPDTQRPAYDPSCYLCPGNARAGGEKNPPYTGTYVFTNDFSALLPDTPGGANNDHGLLIARAERGICRVVNFSPRHDLTLAELRVEEISNVISVWQDEFRSLGALPYINYVQIFENKGAMMGNSNPHPHCQIWAQESLPMEPGKEDRVFRAHYRVARRSLLTQYVALECKLGERLVYRNASFAVLVPFWAVWPYETMVVPLQKRPSILALDGSEKREFADALQTITVKYDNLFRTSFPYSSGLHQAPTDGSQHPEWHFHMHFYPPLLRSASIRKYMVGYEMLAEPQRDITPELSARVLRDLPAQHWKATDR